jgi:hypothetical protein
MKTFNVTFTTTFDMQVTADDAESASDVAYQQFHDLTDTEKVDYMVQCLQADVVDEIDEDDDLG